MSSPAITRFIRDLGAHQHSSVHYVNPYGRVAGRQNLHAYLDFFVAQPPPLLLIGEAPGYRGCAQTGIPFSSPHLLDDHPFFSNLMLAPCDPSPQKEPTATIVWQIFSQLDSTPLCWNAFPFHPHTPGDLHSNRPPSAAELTIGRPFIERLITIFDPPRIAAVGRAAEKQLQMLGISHSYLRHPSRGGKTAFANGLQLLINN